MFRVKTARIPAPVVQFGRWVLGWKVTERNLFVSQVRNKCGIEIGGPSGAFRDSGILPLYRHVQLLDNCVYSTCTPWIWQESERPYYSYAPGKPNGVNFILESTAMTDVPDGRYDFVLSSHNLEHTANPMKALREWVRVSKEGGALILILPYYKFMFDRNRRPTPVAHMIEDFKRSTSEADTTHLEEVLQMHDLTYDDNNSTYEQFRDRCMNNLATRWMHHHVFDENNARELLEAAGFHVRVVEIVRPHHLVLLALH